MLDSTHMQSSNNASVSGVTPCGPAATVADTSGSGVSLNFSAVCSHAEDPRHNSANRMTRHRAVHHVVYLQFKLSKVKEPELDIAV